MRVCNLMSGAMLVAMTTVLILANFAVAGTTPGKEPVLGLRIDIAFWLVAALSGLTGAYCLLGERERLQSGLVAWLAVNFAVYAGGLFWMNGMSLATLLQSGGVANAFGFTAATWVVIAYASFGLLLIGSAVGLYASRSPAAAPAEQRAAAEAETMKMSCPHCSGHIAFPVARLGERLECPHCTKSIQLERAGVPAAI